MRKQQSGVMLLEALIAILIFSLGVLGIVGLQASAVAATRDAKYRTDAGLLANELVGQMMASNRLAAGLQANFEGNAATVCTAVPPSPYCAWRDRVAATLPGVATSLPLVAVLTPGNPPGVPNIPQTASVVSVTVLWMPPNETVPHSYQVVVQII